MGEAFDSEFLVDFTRHFSNSGTYGTDNDWVPGSFSTKPQKGRITAGNKFSQFEEGMAIHNEDGGKRISDYRSLYIKTTEYTIVIGDVIEYRGTYYNTLQQSDESQYGFDSFLLEKSENWTPSTATVERLTPDRADVKVMQSMIDSMVGIPGFSYPARQNSSGFSQPKPDSEFAHIRVIEEYQLGIPNQTILSQTDEETTFRIISPVRIRFRIGVVETTGLPSSKIQHGWTSEAMKALMISSGYGFEICLPLSSEDAKLEKEWEYRKGFTVIMNTTRVFEETVNNILNIQVSGEFNDDVQIAHLLSIEIND